MLCATTKTNQHGWMNKELDDERTSERKTKKKDRKTHEIFREYSDSDSHPPPKTSFHFTTKTTLKQKRGKRRKKERKKKAILFRLVIVNINANTRSGVVWCFTCTRSYRQFAQCAHAFPTISHRIPHSCDRRVCLCLYVPTYHANPLVRTTALNEASYYITIYTRHRYRHRRRVQIRANLNFICSCSSFSLFCISNNNGKRCCRKREAGDALFKIASLLAPLSNQDVPVFSLFFFFYSSSFSSSFSLFRFVVPLRSPNACIQIHRMRSVQDANGDD